MNLDSWLVARLAQELDELLRGARIQAVRSPAGELVLFCYRRGTVVALHAVADSNVPLVAAYEVTGTQKENGSDGWAAAVAALLKGCTVDAVLAVPNDRVLYLDASSRSAFGVPSRSRIVFELQLRKANALVLRSGSHCEWIIVAAAKQFKASGEARDVRIGAPYQPPPQRRPRIDRAQFIVLARDIKTDEHDRLARLLAQFDPGCTPPLAHEVVARVAAAAQTRETGHKLLDAWATLRAQVEKALEEHGEVFVFRKGGAVEVCHLIALTWPSGELATVKTVNELCAAWLREDLTQHGGPAPDALRKRLMTMLSRCEEEYKGLERSRSTAQEADHLRRAGDAIYAHLGNIPAGATQYETPDGSLVLLDPLLTAKENASEYFRKYKKARRGLPRIAARMKPLRFNREYWEHLLWELERARALSPPEQAALMAEMRDALGIKTQRKLARRARVQEQRVELSGGAVAYVGRSPKENERLTFSVAGPNDYWFHARGIPGAHVIVKTDGAPITSKQIEEAAALAAGQSRAAGSVSVEVDYTRRKHVRRHSAQRPGLVWYTDFETVRVAPKSKNV